MSTAQVPNPPVQVSDDVNYESIVQRRRRSDYGDDQYVPDVTISWMYKPHVVTAMLAMVGTLLYLAWKTSDEADTVKSVKTAVLAISVFMVILGCMVFPSGPFIRPHPVLWRAVFALAVLYEIFLIFILFLSKHDARKLMALIDPSLGVPLPEKSYGDNCELTVKNLWDACDVFILAHFVGWFAKALVIRDPVICWVMSIGWELTEICFKHMLPNFEECWWDSWIFDVLVCNGLGIYLGCKTCEYFEAMDYNWKGVHRYPSYATKAKRVLLQFVPESWMNVRWKGTESLKRFFGVHFLVLLMLLQELNSFFLKQLLWLPPPHFLNIARLALWFAFSLPALRQIYIYMSDPTVKSVGRQAFVCVILLTTELLICIKFGQNEFNQTMSTHAFYVMIFLITSYLIFSIGMVIYILRRHPQDDTHKQVAVALDALPLVVLPETEIASRSTSKLNAPVDTADESAKPAVEQTPVVVVPKVSTTERQTSSPTRRRASSRTRAARGETPTVDTVRSLDAPVTRPVRRSSSRAATTRTSTGGTGASTSSSSSSSTTTTQTRRVTRASSRAPTTR